MAIKLPEICNLYEMMDGQLYEYDNGLKVFYKKNTDTTQDDRITFLFQGPFEQRFYGLAHLVEHSLYLSGQLENIAHYSNAFTSSDDVGFYFDFGPKINLESILQAQTAGEEDADLRLLNYINIENEQLQKITTAMFDEIDGKAWKSDISKTFFSEIQFENEKHIINDEFTRSNNDFFIYFLTNSCRNQKYVCGNIKTLKNATIEDLIDFKKKNFILENMLINVTSKLDYNYLEATLLQTVCDKVNSAKPQLLKREENNITRGGYYMVDLPSTKNTVDVANILHTTFKPKDFKRMYSTILYFITMFESKDISKFLRHESGLIYETPQVALSVSKNGIDTQMIKQNLDEHKLNEYIMQSSRLWRDMFVKAGDIEKYYNFKKSLDELAIDDNFFQYVRVENIEDAKMFTPNMKDDILQYLAKVSRPQLMKDVDWFRHHSQFCVLLSKNIDKKQLPPFERLHDIVINKEGCITKYPSNAKDNSVKLVKDKTSSILPVVLEK